MPLVKKNKSILIICPYPANIAPGQRFRYEMYLDDLRDYSITYETKSFLDKETNSILFKNKFYFKKSIGVIKGFCKRILLLFKLSRYDFIFIFREATPMGPPFVEWVISKILRKNIIYDFDDAIWLPFKSETNWLSNKLKWTHKVGNICKWSHGVICGNEYLANYARRYNDNVFVIPTVVDTEKGHNRQKDFQLCQKSNITIGWTGSHSTNQYLDIVLPVLINLQKKYTVKYVFISGKKMELKGLDYEFILWTEETEVQDLLKMDIGIMPLTDDEWAKGKCGFKAIQYLSLGIPAVVTPVGVNSEIVIEEETGFLADSLTDWENSLEKLITDDKLRKKMGEKGRQHIIKNYSKQATITKFMSMFNYAK